jgi:hypothetical protein
MDRGRFHLLPLSLATQPFPLDANNVACYNQYEVLGSTPFVFSADHNFEVARKICAAFPEVTDLDRQRIVVRPGPRRRPCKQRRP